MEVHARRGSHALPKNLHELGVERPDRRHRKIHGEDAGGPAAEIDGHGREGLVHRDDCVAVAADPTAFAQAVLEREAERPAHVLHRVVTIDVQVALAAHREIKQRVAREQREHVVEEAGASLDVGPACAIEAERERDLGLGGVAGDGCGAGHDGFGSLG